MEIKKLERDALTAQETASLAEIVRGFTAASPDWGALRRRMKKSEAWGFYDGTFLVGFAMLSVDSLMTGAAQLTAFCYRWEYSGEEPILAMLGALARTYCGRARCLLLDISRTHELNWELYRRFGFRESLLCSPQGGENVILIAGLQTCANGSR